MSLKLLFWLTLVAALAILVMTRWQRIKLGLKVAVGLWIGLAVLSLAQTGVDADALQTLALICAAGLAVYGLGRLAEHVIDRRRQS